MKYQVMPDLTPIEYEALKADIASNGVLIPVEMDENGDLLDGHHRVRAWEELQGEGVNLPDYPSIIRAGMTEEQKRNHARRLNVLRRQLTPEQRREIAQDMLRDGATVDDAADATGVSRRMAEMYTKEIRDEQRQERNEEIERMAAQGWTQREIAEKVGVTQPTVKNVLSDKKTKDFDFLSDNQPSTLTVFAYDSKERERTQDAFSKMTTPVSGTFTANGLHREARKQLQEQRITTTPAIPSGKYRVIYADPPWQYGNVMPDYATEQADHYSLLTVSEIAALPIADMAEDDAVLFLWVTSPILEESFEVINAWGFKYKSSFVWDKIKHNMGHYNSVRHELLLVCTRGSCQPDVRKLFDSVQSIERTQHSVKPDEFRTIIDTIYPRGARVELFARRPAEGWDRWGNEA